MYNFNLPNLPERSKKSRISGITMVMDKGLSVHDSENFADASADFTDFVKFGFGTSILTNNLQKKIDIYKEAHIKPYFGGTLFEAFLIRNMLDDYMKYLDKYKVETIEVSDGSMKIPHEKKCEIIQKLSSNYQIISEVGSKEAGVVIPPERWTSMMKDELEAGSFKVIAEARESGNVGIYNTSGGAETALIKNILKTVKADDIIWETPLKAQVVWFVKLLGANVNLGNIAPNEVIPTETLRLGLRGDTFLHFLPDALKKNNL